MNENTSLTSSEIAGVAVHAVVKIARNRFRWVLVAVAILLGVIAVQAFAVVSQHGTIDNNQVAYSQLQAKSNEQTIAEVQLRDDVNSFRKLNTALSANHTSALAVYCSIAITIHDTLPPVAKYCSAKHP